MSLDGLGKWFSNGDNLAGLGGFLGAAGNIYGAYNQNKMARKMYKLQLGDYERQKRRQKQSENAFNQGFLVDLSAHTQA